MFGLSLLKLKYNKLVLLQVVVHALAWFLVALLAIQAATDNLSSNPIQLAEQRTGRYAVYFLLLTLACTPLKSLLGFNQAVKVRRSFGLYSFFFAVIHVVILIGIDYQFNIPQLLADVGTKKYILAGVFTMLILIPLAATSFDFWKKKLRKNWKRLHRLVYLAGPSAMLHFIWARKDDLFGLQGNIIQPVFLTLVLLFLLLVRLPVVKRRLVALRYQIIRKKRQVV